MFRLECSLLDEPGVIYRLLDTIAEAHLNIVKEDSCTIDGGPTSGIIHYIDLVLDWSEAGSLADPLPVYPSDHVLYSSLLNRIPIEDSRYLRLFELIMLKCGKTIAFDRAVRSAPPLPSIRMQPFSYRSAGENAVTKTLAAEKHLRVGIELTDGEFARIRSATGHSDDEDITYLISSDGESRTLRVVFLNRQSERSIEHVAFRHRDQPGVLSAIGAALEKGGFNIATSLLRKEFRDESVWEVVVEYQGDPKLLEPRKGELGRFDDSPERVARRLRNLVFDDVLEARLQDAQIWVAAPSYPKCNAEPIPLIPARAASERKGSVPQPGARSPARGTRYGMEVYDFHKDEIATLVREFERDRESHELERSRRSREAVRIVEILSQSVTRAKPRLFLSYSRHASGLAQQLKQIILLAGHFDIDEYQDPDSKKASETALTRIRSSDLFAAIWLGEEGTKDVSPWMHFELGAARAILKPWEVAPDKALSESIVRRIDPEIVHETFDRDTFASDYANGFADRILRRWNKYLQRRFERLA